ncbi:hypothetical protein J0910_16105 [Nocardiopsis sp. CNT-189]|uniref:DUF6086 family protein n=1 Tax=Nocardiopsis oceanisediminis TaxID=2816862 RepID=UPI003B2950A4
MSHYYELGEETLWNPSNGVSRLFLAQAAAFEAELGLPSGIGPMAEDECRIDPAAFGAFARALLTRYRSTGHPVAAALSEGFTAAVLVLAERAGLRATLPGAPADPAAAGRTARLRERARELDRSMHR